LEEGLFVSERKSVRNLVAVAFISLALCVIIYHHAVSVTPILRTTVATFAGATFVTVNLPEIGAFDLKKCWGARILSLEAGSYFVRKSLDYNSFDAIASSIGLYVALWLGLSFLAYLVTLREAALLPILGTFAGVCFGYTLGIGDRIYPWDMPALFFYTLFVCLLVRRRLVWIIPILPVAVLFKETAILLALALLFDKSFDRRRRWAMFAIAFGLAVETRILAQNAVGSVDIHWRLPLANLQALFLLKFPAMHSNQFGLGFVNHPMFINAGLLVAFIIARSDGEHMPALRLIFWIYVAAMLLLGVIIEYRIWFELIPISLYPFYAHQIQSAKAVDNAGGTPEPAAGQ
jgi:hypothetical protein